MTEEPSPVQAGGRAGCGEDASGDARTPPGGLSRPYRLRPFPGGGSRHSKALSSGAQERRSALARAAACSRRSANASSISRPTLARPTFAALASVALKVAEVGAQDVEIARVPIDAARGSDAGAATADRAVWPEPIEVAERQLLAPNALKPLARCQDFSVGKMTSYRWRVASKGSPFAIRYSPASAQLGRQPAPVVRHYR